jgi:nitrite reductase (NADH) small subunit
MAEWVRLCAAHDAPKAGDLKQAEAKGVVLCLANVDGVLAAMDDHCPHRGGPLSEGWIEGETVVCPWHSWAFDCRTGKTAPPDSGEVAVYPVKLEGDAVLVQLEPTTSPQA